VLPAPPPPQGSQSVKPLQEYPKMKYHPNGRRFTVKDAQTEAALGEGWGDKPI
jgi:hypothetical protein